MVFLADCFMTAGAKNILCTLWNVTDRFAQKFMVEFYRQLLKRDDFQPGFTECEDPYDRGAFNLPPDQLGHICIDRRVKSVLL